MDTHTARLREIYARAADGYDRELDFGDRWLFPGCREWACARTEGEVLDLGIGSGRNLDWYPDSARITGADLSPDMLALAERQARRLGREVTLVEADAGRLPWPDERFDAVVIALGLDVFPDPAAVAQEVRRVLRPGGVLRAFNFVRSANPVAALIQRLAEPTFAAGGGISLTRDVRPDIRAAGLRIERCATARWGTVMRLVARRPAVNG